MRLILASIVLLGVLGLVSVAHAGELSGTINLSDMGVTWQGATFNGIDPNDVAGVYVSDAGDVNGDGFADILIGAKGAQPTGFESGETYLIYGHDKTSPLSGSIDLADVGSSVGGAVFIGIKGGDLSGVSVSSAGDFNGDGIDDLLIGALGTDTNGGASGSTYLVYGKSGAEAFSGTFSLSQVGNSIDGVVFNGFGQSGVSVSEAGDINGDGTDDVLIGAWFANGGAGQAYVLYGQSGASALSGAINLLDVGSAVDGFILNGIGANDLAGRSVSNAGDVNGDGMADLLVGAILGDANGADSGEAYLVYGKDGADELSGSFDLSDVGITIDGVTFGGVAAGDGFGDGVAAAGDVNGDGFDDILIGGPGADPNGRAQAGQAVLVYGQSGSSTLSGTIDLADVGTSVFGAIFNGSSAEDDIGDFGSLSRAGDVNGDGFDDFLIGGALADPNGDESGLTYLIYGQTGGLALSGTIDLSRVGTSIKGVIFNGIDALDNSGLRVSSAGDVNNDGIDDFLIGAWLADPKGNNQAGETYLVYGQAAVPEPGTLFLMGMGIVGIVHKVHRRRIK